MSNRRLCVVLATAAGCQAANAGDPKPAERFEHDMMARFHMHENFGLLRAIELELIHGKLEDGKLLARSIAEAPDEPGLQPFAKRIAAVRDAAAALAAAPSIDEGLRREARLGAACADCHVDAGVLPEFANPPRLPADDNSVKARMARHRWASDRLWEGLVGNADESWRAGLDVLAATPLPWTAADADRQALAKRLQQLADEARKTQATDQLRDRSRAYGEILTTCAGCHTTKAAKS
jgi:cytochrome c553